MVGRKSRVRRRWPPGASHGTGSNSREKPVEHATNLKGWRGEANCGAPLRDGWQPPAHNHELREDKQASLHQEKNGGLGMPLIPEARRHSEIARRALAQRSSKIVTGSDCLGHQSSHPPKPAHHEHCKAVPRIAEPLRNSRRRNYTPLLLQAGQD